MDFQALQAKYGPLAVAQPSSKTAAPKSRSGLSKWLPTALAVGGTLAAAPFTGGTSLLGTAALLGGGAAIGGAAGEFGAQKLNKEKTNAGKIGKEALISGATGAIPLGGAAKTARIARAADTAVADTATQGSKSLLTKARESMALHGQQMDARSGGFAVNAKQAGSKELDIAGSKKVGQVLSGEGIKAGSPLSKLNAVESKLKQYGSTIDKTLASSNVTVSRGQRQVIADKFVADMAKKLGSNKSVMDHAQNLATNFVKNGGNDAKTLVASKRQLDEDLISYIRNPDSALAHEQRAVVPFRQTLKDEINNLVPGLKEANNKYHDLSTAKGYLVKGTGEMNTKGGVIGRLAESGPIKTAESKVGSLLQRAEPTATAPSSGMTGRVVREGVKQTVGQAVGNGIVGSPAPVDNSTTDSSAVLPPDTSATDTTQNDTIKQALLAAMVQDLGNGGKNVASLSTIYKIVQADQPKAIKKTESQRARDEASTLTDKAISLLDKGSVRTGFLGTKIEGVKRLTGNADPETLEFNTTVDSLKAAIAKARAGTSFTPNEEALLNKYAPTSGDTGQVLRTKLSALKQVYQQAAEREYGSSQANAVSGISLDDLVNLAGAQS